MTFFPRWFSTPFLNRLFSSCCHQLPGPQRPVVWPRCLSPFQTFCFFFWHKTGEKNMVQPSKSSNGASWSGCFLFLFFENRTLFLLGKTTGWPLNYFFSTNIYYIIFALVHHPACFPSMRNSLPRCCHL